MKHLNIVKDKNGNVVRAEEIEMSQEWEIKFDEKFKVTGVGTKVEHFGWWDGTPQPEAIKAFIRSLLQSQTEANGYDNDGNPIKYGYSGGPDKRPPQGLVDFALVKSLISDCICKSVLTVGSKISETSLNNLANEYADKFIARFGVPVVKLPEYKEYSLPKGLNSSEVSFDEDSVAYGINRTIDLVREELDRVGVKWE